MTKTAIEWTEETWNPVTGCTKVSPGCDHCYAERITNRWKGPGAFDHVTLHPDRLEAPLRRRKPTMWFVNSMSDLFHKDVPTEFIGRVFNIMGSAPDHIFQVLTKRPGPMAATLKAYYTVLGMEPFANVWVGTSVEDQKWADVRIPKLLETPAAVRFLSCEPLLGPVDLRLNVDELARRLGAPRPCVNWVIVGGESGPGARPMHPEWARSLRDQCARASVPFFFKQWGGRTPKAGGRELDGRLWDDMPSPDAHLTPEDDAK